MKWAHTFGNVKNIIARTEQRSMMSDATGFSTKQKNMPISRSWNPSWEACLRTVNECDRFIRETLTFVPFLIITLILCLPCPDVFADIPAETAIRILIGEAADQGAIGMQAVAEVVRRRATASAFSTLRRKDLDAFIARQAAWFKSVRHQDLYAVAREAWDKSARSDLTHQATLYENIEAFGFPQSWDRSKVVRVAKIGRHTFFREVPARTRGRS